MTTLPSRSSVVQRSLLHVGRDAQKLLGDAEHRHLDGTAPALEDLHRQQVSRLHVQHLVGEVVGQHYAARRDADGLQAAVERAVQFAVGLDAEERGAVAVVAEVQDGGHVAQALDVHHARQGGQFVQRLARGRLDEGQRQILARGVAELHIHHEVDCALLVVADHHQAAGAGDAEDGQQRLDRASLDVADDHA